MFFVLEEDVLFAPMQVGFSCAGAVMFQAGGFMNFLEEGRIGHTDFMFARMWL